MARKGEGPKVPEGDVDVVDPSAPLEVDSRWERRLLEDLVNRAVLEVRRLEAQLRTAKAAERRARSNLAELDEERRL